MHEMRIIVTGVSMVWCACVSVILSVCLSVTHLWPAETDEWIEMKTCGGQGTLYYREIPIPPRFDAPVAILLWPVIILHDVTCSRRTLLKSISHQHHLSLYLLNTITLVFVTLNTVHTTCLHCWSRHPIKTTNQDRWWSWCELSSTSILQSYILCWLVQSRQLFLQNFCVY